MEPARERAAISSPSRNVLLLSLVVAVVFMTTCAATATGAAPSTAAAAAAAPSARAEAWRHTPRTSFVPNPHRRLGSLRHRRPSFDSVQAVRPGKEGASKRGRIAVDADSWYLGDGGFADRHLDDEEHIAAKKTEKEFFRKRSLSVYDQMKEASMLLLAQQQVLAAEEEREEASKPRFVAAKGGTQAARAQAIRDRRKKREAVAGLLPEPPATAAATATVGETGASKSGKAAAAAAGEGGRGLTVPTGEGALSGESLGVGGLDEELEEIRRRVCIPLAVPADLLEDLGISPVRGMLLHGPPGCGKTLLARRLSAALTPRPPTVVSGPEILERFVGSSEANIRALFDYPPDVPGGGDAEQAEALHVIVLDEFDSIGQRRGGGDDGGDRVRDSVVNQLLARMDGFQELERPTLLVALTNRIDLLDTALLRPGRFEVQVQIPGPDRTGREAILRIHTQRMHQAGRIETPPPDATPASAPPASVGGTGGDGGDDGGYDALVSSLAAVTDGFTGAELAGLVRAAASYALERAVGGAAGGDDTSGSGNGAGAAAADCRVTAEDFGRGLADVARSKSPAAAERPSARGEGALLTPSAAALIAGGGGGSREEGVGVGAGVGVGTMAGASSDADGEGGGGVGRAGAVGKSKPTAAAAAAAASVAAARLDRDIGGSLSREDLESVQKLLLQKTSQKEEEDVLLLDAAQVVAQRRRGGVDGGDKRAETGEEAGGGGGGAEGSASRKLKMRRFENTGWFHTYE